MNVQKYDHISHFKELLFQNRNKTIPEIIPQTFFLLSQKISDVLQKGL